MTAPLFAIDTLTIDYLLVIEKCLVGTGKPCFTVEAYHKDRSHLLIGLHETLEAACREACRVGHDADCHSIRLCLNAEARS